MSQLTTKDKVSRGKKITESTPKIIFKKIFHPILGLLANSKVTYKVCRENKYKRIYRRPIIFCVNHTCFQDTPIMCKALPKQAYMLLGKQSLYPIDELFFHLNGTIFVDRKDREDTFLSKIAMEEYLRRKQDLIIFPEGTWNLTDDLLMMEMKWGIIQIAKNTNAQIIPVSLDYEQKSKRCYVKFGEPILPETFGSKAEAINQLRDTMATLKWEQMERYGMVERSQEWIDEEREKIKQRLAEYPPYDYGYEQSIIFDTKIPPEEVFEPIKKLELTKKNAFLFSKHYKGRW